ncbi:MAG: hypothetical protein IT165_16185 [Bryobacterales bacterium]|nr:hypothetical protein [Bryobacterales bacterium]
MPLRSRARRWERDRVRLARLLLRPWPLVDPESPILAWARQVLEEAEQADSADNTRAQR